MKTLVRSVVIAIVALASFSVLALDCPSMPEAARRDISNDLKIALGSVWKLKAIEISNSTEVVPKVIYDKVAAPDKLYFVELSTAIFCSLLRDARDMNEREKIERFVAFQERLSNQLQAKPLQAAPTAVESKKK